MQTEYKRNLQNNYLIIKVEEEAEESYCLQMAEMNTIPGLLAFHSMRMDGRLQIQYEITSKQSLEQLYGKKQMSGEQINKILTEMADMLEAVQGYLLNPAQILFDPKYIYMCAEKRTLQFCYLPEKEPKDTIQILAEFLLKHLDHEDFQAVELGYQFYQCVQEENFSLKKILKELLHREKHSEAERNIRTTDEDEDKTKRELKREEKEEEPESEWKISDTDRNEGYEGYKITHKERRKHEKNAVKTEMLSGLIHPAVLLSALFFFAVIEILYYFRWISLTEAGGMFFLLISAELLANQLWRKRKKEKEEQDIHWISEEEDAIYRILQEEMYEDAGSVNENEKTAILREETPGETVYLGENKKISGLRLIPVAGKKKEGDMYEYQEIAAGNEPVLIGKRKGESDVILNSPAVSRTHALLERRSGNYYVCDLNSKNGTFCNGERLMPQEWRKIESEDLIAFADLEYRAVLYSMSDSA